MRANQFIPEGRVKELMYDLKDKAMSDADFEKKYSKTRAEVRAMMRNNSDNSLTESQMFENLKKWFSQKWVRFGPDGKIKGDCARGSSSEGKPKCLPAAKAHSLGKKGRAAAGARKRRQDPDADRSGKAINVNTKKKSNEAVSEAELDEACWTGYRKDGMKTMFGKRYPNCVKVKKNNEDIEEDNARVARKPGQPADSKKHSDLYTDENPKDTITGLKFATAEDAKDSVSRIRNSGRSHAHKIQAAVAMEQRAKAAGKAEAALVYRKYIDATKKTDEGIDLEEACWDTHRQAGMKNKGGRQVPNCVPKESIEEAAQTCSECGGPAFTDLILAEKQDACYNKVKSRYKVWPSAYASGALVQCRKKGAANWGNGGKNEGVESNDLDEGSYDRDDYYNARQGRDYGKGLTTTGQGGDGSKTRRDDIFKGQSKRLPADPFARTTGAVPTAGTGRIHSTAQPGEMDEGEKIGNMDADAFDAAMARLKQLAGAGPMKTVYDPDRRQYRNMPTAQQPQKQPKK